MGCGTSEQTLQQTSLPKGKDEYQRKEMIGVGNHGRVYRSIHLLTNKEYAIKVIDRFRDLNPNFGAKGKISLADKLKRLVHPSIVAYQQIQAKEEQLCVVMEIAKEGTLKKFIQKNGKITEQIAAKITENILQGLNYLHKQSVIHKDLKSNNILHFPELTFKLTDYSLAELYDQRLSTDQKPKKPKKNQIDFSRGQSVPYMAPEVLKGEEVSEKSDVWSVGCIVIQMLTGKAPWSNINPKFQKAYKQIIKLNYPPLPEVSVECKDFLCKCLAVSTSKRATVPQLLRHSFLGVSTKNISEEQIDEIKICLEKKDAGNRISSRNSNKNKRQQSQEIFKTPPSIQKSFKSQNITLPTLKSVDKVGNHNKKSEGGQIKSNTEQMKRLKEAVNNLGKIKKIKDIKTIHNQDILPEILEDEQDGVMLNNRRVKMSNNPAQKIKTEQTDYSQKREYRNSINHPQNISNFSSNSNERYRISSKKGSNFNDSFERDYSESKVRLETQPILITSELDKSHQYFKRPLKLLKKKLKERQKRYVSNFSPTVDMENGVEVEDQEEEEGVVHQQSKIRTISEQSRQEIAINTQLAKAERDRYINQQLIMRQQKQRQKLKWEQQLQKESQAIKKQFSHRYAYHLFRPLAAI